MNFLSTGIIIVEFVIHSSLFLVKTKILVLSFNSFKGKLLLELTFFDDFLLSASILLYVWLVKSVIFSMVSNLVKREDSDKIQEQSSF